MIRATSLLIVSVCGAACTSSPEIQPLALPSGSPGIGLDDLRYSPAMGSILVPGGRTDGAGTVYVCDPDGGRLLLVED